MNDIDTHVMFNTLTHEHLDDLVSWATGEYPNSGLNLVECAEGRWFIEIDYGHDFDSFLSISNPKYSPYVEPCFYSSREEALKAALGFIRQVHKNLDDKKVADYIKEM